MRWRWSALIAAAPLPLTGCRQEVTLAVVRIGDAVTITARRPGNGKVPCVESLSVAPAGTDVTTTPPSWEVATADPARCRTSFVYGQVPQGFTQGGHAPTLLVGSRYLVQIPGPVLLGGKEFTMRADPGPMTGEAPR